MQAEPKGRSLSEALQPNVLHALRASDCFLHPKMQVLKVVVLRHKQGRLVRVG